MFVSGLMFDLVGKLGRDFESSRNLPGGFGPLEQSNPRGMVSLHPEHPPVEMSSEVLHRLDYCGLTFILLWGLHRYSGPNRDSVNRFFHCNSFVLFR